VRLSKENLGWPTEPLFFIPEKAGEHFRKALERGKAAETDWDDRFSVYSRAFPDLAKAFLQAMRGELPGGWDQDIPVFATDAKGMATRVAAGKVMNAFAGRLPTLIGGSADLNPSTYTALSKLGDFEPADVTVPDKQGAVQGVWSYAGRNMYFGVREHGMGAILNGLAAHGGAVPFGATFLIFSDYMRPPIRLAAMMKLHVIYIFTHDSIALGQDGSTHQPVEQLAGLRAVPGLTVIRPGDANETGAVGLG
jgi:transketolase